MPRQQWNRTGKLGSSMLRSQICAVPPLQSKNSRSEAVSGVDPEAASDGCSGGRVRRMSADVAFETLHADASRDTVTRLPAHEPLGWRPATLLVTVRRFPCTGCRHAWRQDTSKAARLDRAPHPP